ncbi:RING [Seminavis robusta]|uniref:E3 ubiquitin protein ligase n=1 Tax=Seminavis robusta TaxID=568900 RepID=A0A9N8H7Z6_9STRA|nr:RING [Seminavis robusta]|eukprot:Sro79_g042820.1 RING (954) ;mRNA; r:89211-92389
MKRALAERAKQSAALPSSSGNGPLLQVPVQAPSMGSSSSGVGDPSSPRTKPLSSDAYKQDHGRPLKIPRRADAGPEVTNSIGSKHSSTGSPTSALSQAASAMQSESRGANNDVVRQRAEAVPSSNPPVKSRSAAAANRSATPSSSVPSSAGMKRQRPSSQPRVPYPVPSDDEAEDNQQNSFFLKHQNRALASELKSLQHQLTLLEDEREYRRNQCRIASQALNSLQATWTQMETELQQPQQALARPADRDAASYVQQDGPMSTGNGSKVEIVGALFDALAALATTPPPDNLGQDNGEQEEDDDDDDENDEEGRPQRRRNGNYELDPAEKQQLDDLSNISWNILQRANTLEEWIRSVLQKMTSTASAAADGDKGGVSLSSDQRALIKEVGVLRGQSREYKIQIAELAKARDDTAKSERKVRRSIYRLSTGRVKIEQVLKDMDKGDEDGTLAAEARMEAMMEEKGTVSSSSQFDATANTSHDDQMCGVKSESGDPAEMHRVRSQLEELERQLGARDTSIEELQSRLTEKEQRINLLCSKEISDADAEKVEDHQKTQKRLEQVEAELADVQERLKETRENWAKARGDANHALKTLDELHAKQEKRWAELTCVGDQADNNSDEINIPLNVESVDQARKIIELDHKLKQALENVRQADSVRQNLKEALAMNSALQGKLDEIKGKYAALQAGRSNSSSNKSSSESTNHSSSREKSSERSESSSKSEKLHRENRRMRKEIAALSASKDSAKAKLERVEKERDLLNETNSRLLRQSAEKDDMNAKSLSTILHLKNMTDSLTEGKKSLEQQLKSSGQLALAARLATNSKAKVAEEVVKEKKALEEKLRECEERNQSLKKELESTVSEWSQADTNISSLNSQLSKARKRSDELVSEMEREQRERRKLQDSLDVAVKKAGDATEKLNEMSKRDAANGGGGGGGSSFTVDQLNTQVQAYVLQALC